MTLPIHEFSAFILPDKNDKYFSEVPVQRLDDLQPRYEGEIKLSLMISTFNRRAQLTRTLETLCRQSFRAFEVLLNNDNSSQNLVEVVDEYVPYLNIKYFFTPRTSWRSCPSKAFKTMLPHAQGEVIAISHPEIMLDKDAIDFLYNSLTDAFELKSEFDWYVVDGWNKGEPIELEEPYKCKYFWSELRPAFIDERYYPLLDSVNWHSDAKNIQEMSGFWNFGGFSGRSNIETLRKRVFPWWFVGAAERNCPLWNDLPEFLGHGIIDAWMCRYRAINHFMDIISRDAMCYHQPHVTIAFAPEGELIETRPANKINEN